MLLFVLATLFSLALMAVLYLRNDRSAASTRLALFIVSLNAWLFFTFLATNITGDTTYIVRLSFFSAICSAYALRSFITRLRNSKSSYQAYLYVIPSIVAAIAALTPLIIPNATTFAVDGLKETQIDRTPLYFLFLMMVLLNSFSAIFELILHHRTQSLETKKQTQTIIIGVVVIVLSLAFTNAVGPLILDVNTYALSPVGSILGTLIFGYAIFRHGFLDVRFAVARTIAYVASIASVVCIYVVIVLLLSSAELLATNLSTTQRVIYVSIAVFSGFLFNPFKRFFDKWTNKFFYRDSYDAQALIDSLNNTLVNTVDLDSLLTKSSQIIQDNLKTVYVTFFIRETSYFPSRTIGVNETEKSIKHIEELQDAAKHIRRKVHTTREAGSEYDIEVNKLLRSNDFDVMVRLVNTLDYEVKGTGFIFLGPKRSGGQYTKQDMKILEIIANELVIAIQNVLRYEEIEQFNVTLQKKIDDATRELKESNDKLRALDEAKDEFVSMASHQLRTPLTSIKGYLSMVLEGDAGNITETQKTMLGQAFFSSQRMVYLIADLLNVSRLKTGKFLIETKPVYLPDLIESEIDQLQEGASAKNIKLSFTKPKKFPKLMLDDMKIRQVVMNFTDNAIYYTPTGGKIDVSLKESGKSIEFTVKDTGIGVPKEQQHKLFAKFYRADNARKTRPDGTGLGLFMAKKVIVAQGGSIIFKSAENKGSTFGFSFPKEKLQVSEDEQTNKT